LFAECCRRFNEAGDIEVKRGKETLTTTVAREAEKQIEMYLSNTGTRLKRAAKKINRN